MAVFFAAVCARADLVIYRDAVTNGFEDRGWAPRNFTNAAPVHSGKFSISASPAQAWQGLWFFHAEFDSTPYDSVSFWANGGPVGGQRLQVLGVVTNISQIPKVYFRCTCPTNSWEKFTVPLADLAVAGKSNFSGIWIQMMPGDSSNTFYIDDVQLNGQPAPQPVVVAAAAAPAAAPPVTPPPAANAAWWIAGVLTVITGLLAWLILMLRRSGLGKADALAVVPATALAKRDALGTGADDWQQRALAAEAMAGKQAQILSDKVIPELKEFAKQSLVQGLYAQRNALLETQQRAQQDLTQLEARLADLQLPFQGRILAYEKRITELEKELETRGDEMRELTRATLLLVRQKLEEEKRLENERSRFN
jgi:hypothetical protein